MTLGAECDEGVGEEDSAAVPGQGAGWVCRGRRRMRSLAVWAVRDEELETLCGEPGAFGGGTGKGLADRPDAAASGGSADCVRCDGEGPTY